MLGCGRDLTQRLNTDPASGPTFADNFEQVDTMDTDYKVEPTFLCSIDGPWWYYTNYDEVHAYEVLHLAGRGADGFFKVWRNIWQALKPGGLCFAMVPWWESVWAFQDPASVQVYSPEKLQYLNQRYYSQPTTTGYNHSAWVPPYSFVARGSWMRGTNPKLAGFSFVLEKEVYEG